jgi:hypothetical protein
VLWILSEKHFVGELEQSEHWEIILHQIVMFQHEFIDQMEHSQQHLLLILFMQDERRISADSPQVVRHTVGEEILSDNSEMDQHQIRSIQEQ